mgnify:CR=1 FL=1
MSFIKLKRTLKEALNTGASPSVNIWNFTQVALNPNEQYLQYSDVSGGVDFDGNYTVHICKCDGTELLDITSKVAILEMVVDGLTQFAFEIAPLRVSYYTPVLLKFKHGVSDLTLYSNRFIVKNDSKTTRIDYLDYTRPINLYQSIRLNMYFDREDADSEITEYTQINGNKVSGRAIKTDLEIYKFDFLDGFTFKNLNNLLTTPIVYFNSKRVTNKQILNSVARDGDTNYWSQEIIVPIDSNDTFTDTYQIFPNFEAIEFIPFGFNTSASAGTELKVIFSKDVTKNVGLEIKLFKDGVLNQTFTYADVAVTGSEISVNCGTLANGEYYVTITADSFTSIDLENSVYLTWDFEITAGEFDSSDFTDEFLID